MIEISCSNINQRTSFEYFHRLHSAKKELTEVKRVCSVIDIVCYKCGVTIYSVQGRLDLVSVVLGNRIQQYHCLVYYIEYAVVARATAEHKSHKNVTLNMCISAYPFQE